MSYQSKFADELRAFMAEKEISQATVARLTGLNSGTISRVLSGKTKVSYDTVIKIAKKLEMWRGLTPTELNESLEEFTFRLSYEKEKNHKLHYLMRFILIVICSGVLIWMLV